MQNKENIETLFKDTFEHFEADVNPNVWGHVQSGISSSAGSGAVSSIAKLALGKIITGGVVIAVVAGGAWYFYKNSYIVPGPGSHTTSPSSAMAPAEKPIENTFTENNNHSSLSNSQASKQTASTNPSLQPSQTNTPLKEESIVGSTENQTSDQTVSEENLNQTPAAHKYGNAPKDDGGMIRWNKPAYDPSHPNTNNDADRQEEDASSPAANIFVNTASGDAPLTVEFINQGVASTMYWDFGDGSGSKENAPTHVFKKAGTYQVILTAKGALGNATDKITIEVAATSSITNIPNIFTPNGDGLYDLFYFEMNAISSVGVVIFNQKNGIVAQWNTLEGNWNGKLLNGDDAPEGVYFYTIQANGTDGVPHSEKGAVTLSRH